MDDWDSYVEKKLINRMKKMEQFEKDFLEGKIRFSENLRFVSYIELPKRSFKENIEKQNS